MALRKGNAVLWVRLAMAGSMFLAVCALLGMVRLPLLPVQGHGIWAEVWVYRLRALELPLPIAIGLGLMVWAERRFNRGYEDDLWGAAELAQVRRFTEQKLWVILSGCIFGLWCLALFCIHSSWGGGLIYLMMMPTQTAQRIRSLITPRVERSSPLQDWRNFGPLRSEHWGERSAS